MLDVWFVASNNLGGKSTTVGIVVRTIQIASNNGSGAMAKSNSGVFHLRTGQHPSSSSTQVSVRVCAVLLYVPVGVMDVCLFVCVCVCVCVCELFAGVV
jgi:hypothetical protein